MKKTFLINLSIFILLLSTLLVLLKVLNLFISGPPRYYEIVYNSENTDLKYKKEKLVYYKSKKNLIETNNFHKYELDNYKDSEFSGPIINANCGSLESGINELFYVSDKMGFRENKDNLYEKTDYVLLGDSFTMSICENRPNDLKSQLQKLNHNIKYLNLGIHNINFVKQVSVLLNITKDTEFDTLIWFFYEGNDYNDSIDKYDSYKPFQSAQAYEYENKDFNNSLPKYINKIDYQLNKEFKITNFYKFKVWLAETVNGLSSLLKFFKDYDKLLNENEYNEALKIANDYLNTKNIKNRFIYYIPSWQRLSNHKSKKIGFYKKNPQIKQLDQLKDSVEKISKKNGFIFIDGDNKFINLKDPLKVFHYKLNTHFNRMGYKILAEDVYNKTVLLKK